LESSEVHVMPNFCDQGSPLLKHIAYEFYNELISHHDIDFFLDQIVNSLKKYEGIGVTIEKGREVNSLGYVFYNSRLREALIILDNSLPELVMMHIVVHEILHILRKGRLGRTFEGSSMQRLEESVIELVAAKLLERSAVSQTLRLPFLLVHEINLGNGQTIIPSIYRKLSLPYYFNSLRLAAEETARLITECKGTSNISHIELKIYTLLRNVNGSLCYWERDIALFNSDVASHPSLEKENLHKIPLSFSQLRSAIELTIYRSSLAILAAKDISHRSKLDILNWGNIKCNILTYRTDNTRPESTEHDYGRFRKYIEEESSFYYYKPHRRTKQETSGGFLFQPSIYLDHELRSGYSDFSHRTCRDEIKRWQKLADMIEMDKSTSAEVLIPIWQTKIGLEGDIQISQYILRERDGGTVSK